MADDAAAAGEDKRGLRHLLFARLPLWAGGALLLVGLAINFANVVGRYGFNRSIFWAEEIMVFIVIWCVFIGLIAISYNADHLRMDLFTARLAGAWRRLVNGLMVAVLLASCVFAVMQSWQVVALMARFGQVSVTAAVPLWIPHAAILAGFAATALVVVLRLRTYLTGRP